MSEQTESQTAVEITGLTKRIGNKTIVDNLTFVVRKGEVFGFLGPNGAGKTTTIRMMVGLMSITSGTVSVSGIDIRQNFREAMKHIGVIVENPEMYKYLTGYQNLVHFARMTPGVNRDRIDEVVRLIGLQARIHDKVKTYSLGMRQRLGLAQALLHRPRVLILDEPTNGLDPAGIREFRDYLRRLAREEGLAVIVSSHLLSEMELMCDRVAVIQHGKLIGIEKVRDLVQQGDSRRTRFETDNPDAAAAEIRRHLQAAGDENASLEQGDTSVEVLVERHQIPGLIAALVATGINIYGVETTGKSLEDTFLQMTGGNEIV